MKDKLLHMLTNFGQPFIDVEDGNFENRGELLLAHRHEGVDLKLDYARDTLRNLQTLVATPGEPRHEGGGARHPLPLRRQGALRQARRAVAAPPGDPTRTRGTRTARGVGASPTAPGVEFRFTGSTC